MEPGPTLDSLHVLFLILTTELGIAYCLWPRDEDMGLERLSSLPKPTQVMSSHLDSNHWHRNTHSPPGPQSLPCGTAGVRPK